MSAVAVLMFAPAHVRDQLARHVDEAIDAHELASATDDPTIAMALFDAADDRLRWVTAVEQEYLAPRHAR